MARNKRRRLAQDVISLPAVSVAAQYSENLPQQQAKRPAFTAGYVLRANDKQAAEVMRQERALWSSSYGVRDEDSFSDASDGDAPLTCLYFSTDPPSGDRLWSRATISGIQTLVLPSQSSTVNLCNEQDARRFNMRCRKTGLTVNGLAGGFLTWGAHRVDMKMGQYTWATRFRVVNNPDLPIIIGGPTLRKFGQAFFWLGRMSSQPLCIAAGEMETADLMAAHKVSLNGLTSHLSVAAKQKLYEVLMKHKDCWVRPRCGRAKFSEATITAHRGPIACYGKFTCNSLQGVLREKLDEMIDEGVLVPSNSKWRSLPVLKKKSGEWRVCMDFAELNERIAKDHYPIPDQWDVVRRAAGYEYVITLDLQNALWNIPLKKESQPLTAVATHRGLLQFAVVPFGLKTSAAICQRAVDNMLKDLYHEGVATCGDDIAIFAHDLETCLSLLDDVMSRCCRFGFYLKLRKSNFLLPQTRFLGFSISRDGILPDPETVNPFRNRTVPCNRGEVRQFLDSLTYFGRFDYFIGLLSIPLVDLSNETDRTPFVWRRCHQQAFANLKMAASCDDPLKPLQLHGQIFIYCFLWERAAGFVLKQEQDGEPKSIEFGYKVFTAQQRQWTALEQQVSAVLDAVTKWHNEVKARGATILTEYPLLDCIERCNSQRLQSFYETLKNYNISYT